MNIGLDEPTILIVSGECYSSKSRNSKWFEMNTKSRHMGYVASTVARAYGQKPLSPSRALYRW